MSISRRSFLKGAAAASLAVAASGILAGCNVSGGLTGGAYISGSKTGSIKVNDASTIDIAASSVQVIEYNNTLALKVKVTNNMTGNNLTIANAASSNYVLVPSIVVNGEDELDTPKYSDATVKSVAHGESEETTLIFEPKLKNWSTAEVTLTLYNNSDKVGEPVVFKIKK